MDVETTSKTENAELDDGENEGISEGMARLNADIEAEAFYNPVQEFNRDLTIIVLKAFVEQREERRQKRDEENKAREGKEPEPKQRKTTESGDRHSEGGVRVLDALSASGLRAIRFALEVPSVDQVLANDFSEKAFETIRRNVELNGVQDRVKPVCSDAVDLMMEHRKFEKRFHAIDLDPYGSASTFLDAAVQAVVDGGILMVTCTDTAILCGNTPEACYNKYGSVPLRHKSCHELALRILLYSIESHANRHKRYIVPLLSVSVDFYIRCFVTIFTGAKAAKDSVTKFSHVLCCATCQTLDFQPLIRKCVNGPSVRFSVAHFNSALIRCSSAADAENGRTKSECAHCGGTAIHAGGPIWVAPMHDADFVQKLINGLRQFPAGDRRLGTHDRLEGVLSVVAEELHDVPLYYEHDQLMNVVKCPAPKLSTLRSALLNAGFRCSISHCNPKAIKTDAPPTFLWDICRQWAKKYRIKSQSLKSSATMKRILETKPKFNVDFTPHPNAIVENRSALFPRCKIKIKRLASADNEPVFLQREKPAKRRTNSQPDSNLLNRPSIPNTPEHYWDVNYPTRNEQNQRGYLIPANSPLFKKKKSAKRRIL